MENSISESKKEIAIFVSHRIDLDSKIIDNPIYHPVRCGAAFDERKDCVIPGDNTGDNISDLRIPFCEFTVQYWAWKNYDADYYGLCHYRRFLSFAPKFVRGNDYGVAIEHSFDRTTVNKYQLFNNFNMEKEICDSDIVIGKPFDTTKITRISPKKSVLELWQASEELVENDAIDLIADIVREKYPQYYPSFEAYLESNYYYGYNCYVMKKELFNMLCEFQFGVLFEFYERYDMTGFEGNKLRAPGYMGEILMGTFMCYIRKNTGCVVKEKQIIFYDNTGCTDEDNRLITRIPRDEEFKDLVRQKGDIKIFNSHRIDLDSEIVKAPFYHHTRCGAVYDHRPDITMDGDNTGNNISFLRSNFCELTVMYWAWKNFDANYYGLCHYRRYLSLSEQSFERNNRGYVYERKLDAKTIKKYSLNSKSAIKKLTRSYDMIFGGSMNVDDIDFLYEGKRAKCVHDIFMTQEHLYDNEAPILVLELIDELFPQYSEAAKEYMESKEYYAYNCFVMSKELYDLLCEFQFGVLTEFVKRFDMTGYTGNKIRTPGYMSEIMYGVFIYWLKRQEKYRVNEVDLVFFSDTNKPKTPVKAKTSLTKRIMYKLSPAYRAALSAEQQLDHYVTANRIPVPAHFHKFVPGFLAKNRDHTFGDYLQRIPYFLSPTYRVSLRTDYKLRVLAGVKGAGVPAAGARPAPQSPTSLRKMLWDNKTLTSNISLNIACFAQELHETHKRSFAEFKYCHTGKAVAIIASGPTMAYYSQIKNIPHIGMNSSFKNESIKLDYYFTTDYEMQNDWFEELKDHDFIKFFGQYSTGEFRDKYQVNERLVYENNARRFFQAAPSEDIHLDIEFYPLMGFYSIAFQAIHFALYTNAKTIYLVGCDCTSSGYYDGSAQKEISALEKGSLPTWKRGYAKLKDFVERFYPDTEIISVNPVGLRGLFREVWTENYLAEHPEIERSECEILDTEEYI